MVSPPHMISIKTITYEGANIGAKSAYKSGSWWKSGGKICLDKEKSGRRLFTLVTWYLVSISLIKKTGGCEVRLIE